MQETSKTLFKLQIPKNAVIKGLEQLNNSIIIANLISRAINVIIVKRKRLNFTKPKTTDINCAGSGNKLNMNKKPLPFFLNQSNIEISFGFDFFRKCFPKSTPRRKSIIWPSVFAIAETNATIQGLRPVIKYPANITSIGAGRKNNEKKNIT